MNFREYILKDNVNENISKLSDEKLIKFVNSNSKLPMISPALGNQLKAVMKELKKRGVKI